MADDQFHRWLRRRRMVTDSTIESYEYDIRRLEHSCGVPRDQLTLTHVETFMANGYAHATKQRTFIAFRLRHRWGALVGKWELDEEIDQVRIRRRRGPVKPALTAAQARRALALATTAVEKRTFYLGLYTGIRLGSMTVINEKLWRDQTITVPPIKGSWEPLTLPVHPELAARRAEILSESPGRRRIQRACKRIGALLGLDMSPQWLRRTYSQRHRFLRTEASVRNELMGHAPASVGDEYYAPPTWEELIEAMVRFHY